MVYGKWVEEKGSSAGVKRENSFKRSKRKWTEEAESGREKGKG